MLVFAAVLFGALVEDIVERMLQVAVQRGQTLERAMSIRDGIFSDASLFLAVRSPYRFTIPQITQLFFITIYTTSSYLMIFAVLAVLKVIR